MTYHHHAIDQLREQIERNARDRREIRFLIAGHVLVASLAIAALIALRYLS